MKNRFTQKLANAFSEYAKWAKSISNGTVIVAHLPLLTTLFVLYALFVMNGTGGFDLRLMVIDLIVVSTVGGLIQYWFLKRFFNAFGRR